jgi:phosphoribosylamine--glycine ligase/phosphoribosylformylglycinamidine cyclo-ligase
VNQGRQPGSQYGGMGVYAPVPFISDTDMSVIEQTIIMPTLEGLRSEGESSITTDYSL